MVGTRHCLWIALAGLVVFFTHLGATRLWDLDEGYFAGTAAEMHARGEWLVPIFNDELFTRKPPLMFWMMRFGYALFGVNEFAARFWSAVFAIATALLTYQIGRRLLDRTAAFWGGLAMTSTLMFTVVGRAATQDSFLVFFCTLAMWCFVRGAGPSLAESRDGQPNAWDLRRGPIGIGWAVGMYAAMGVAVLAKGPIGVLLPMASIGLFLLVMTPPAVPPKNAGWLLRVACRLKPFGPVNFVRAVWTMRPITALAALAAVAGPWYIAIGLRTDGEFLWKFVGLYNVGRFLTPMENHSGPLFYYVPAVLVGFFPWSVFAVPTGIDVAQRIRRREPWRPGVLLLVCWAAVIIGFFSLAQTKLPNYALPAYPALALLTGCFLQRWTCEPGLVRRWWPRAALAVLGTVGLATIVGMPAVANWRVDGRSLLESLTVAPSINEELRTLWFVGLAPLAGAIVCLYLARQERPRHAVAAMATTSVLTVVLLFGWAALRVDRLQNSHQIAETIRRLDADADGRIAQYRYFRPSLIYYAQQPIANCRDLNAAAQFLGGTGEPFLITTDQGYGELKPQLPPDVIVLEQWPQFPRAGSVLVLGREHNLAGRPSTSTRR
jgi:4-amino-4-deoxy-L-arabinose transferase-like glycosyltransferase